MKTNLLAFAVVAMMGIGGINAAFAEDSTNSNTQSHEEHHPEGQKTAPADSKMQDQGSMMGKMDMGQMHSMMGECMKMHKDGKMCEHDTMEKCQSNMKMDDCKKMMKQTKAQEKNKVKK